MSEELKKAKLVRVSYRVDGTFGVLVVDTVPVCVSLERQWANNQRGISCIPTGVYTCVRVDSPKFGKTFEVTNVSGRSEILFHKGNIDDDSHGCIVLGDFFSHWIDGSVSVANSKEAFTKFLSSLTGVDQFELEITGVGDNS